MAYEKTVPLEVLKAGSPPGEEGKHFPDTPVSTASTQYVLLGTDRCHFIIPRPHLGELSYRKGQRTFTVTEKNVCLAVAIATERRQGQ